MNAPAQWRPLSDITADVLREMFRERCEARAILCEAAVYGLHEAIDVLQADAERTGLIDMIGQDAVQAMLAVAFGRFLRAAPPGFIPTPENPPAENSRPRHRLARSTLDAAEYLVRLNDPERLQAWLARRTAAERKAIRRHFEQRKTT
jgi:hypothetical protein